MAERQKQVSDFLSADHLNEIKAIIARAERQTSGEIRVKVILDCDPDLRGKVYEQAVRDFERAGMQNTRDKTGVLVLVVLNEKAFAVIGDSGIHSKLSQEYWDNMARTVSFYFREGNFFVGIYTAVENIGKQLSKHFPRKTDDTNELPDDVIVGGGR